MQSKNKNDSVQLSTRYQQYDFTKRHLRGTPRPEVFPFGEDAQVPPQRQRKISPTITSRYYKQGQSDPYIVNEKEVRIRKLTPTECERLQGFPDGWTEGVSDTQRYKCCGNAVTTNVIRDIMVHLL
ncbi:DNA cytosine methyltransferase [Candidatus Kaiserbacteria bacterium]|nr:DNA cytosine methyltransferase [Candidatus Kaiserbacteria bacterium]